MGAAVLSGDFFARSERDGTNAVFPLLLLPSGVRTARLEALIAAYHCTGTTLPYLICICVGACRDAVGSRHEPSAGRCVRCRGSEQVLPLLRLVRDLVYSAQAIIADLLLVQVYVPGDTHSMCVSNLFLLLLLLDFIESNDFESEANFGQWSRRRSSTHAEDEISRCLSTTETTLDRAGKRRLHGQTCCCQM